MFKKHTILLAFGFTSIPTTAAAVCGDGNLDTAEDCDDGNTTTGDGCDDVCATETGWMCTDAEFNLDFSETFTSDGVHAAPTTNWTLSTDGRTVTQSENSIPGIYVSTLPATGVTATFELTVNTSSDDDYIGWAVGYESGDFYNSDAHWILFDWKQADQTVHCPGYAGLAMHRVQGAYTPNDAWCHNGAASTIARANTLGSTGWSHFQTYSIEMTYNTNNVQVYVDGVLEFDETGFFPGGTFAFYTYSQEGGIFSLVSPTEGLSVCSELDSDSDGLSDNMEDGLGMDSTTDDSDSDGLGDFDEVWTYETDGANPDSDGDGISDGDEVNTYGSDPNNEDSDGDGLSDGDELALGTDMFGTDFDGDGYLDGDDNCPTLVNDQADLDGDDIGDLCDSDDDGDGEDSVLDGGLDCDDTNPSIYFTSDEYCDGIDNNCDGLIDDSTSVDMTYWYLDGDQDGYGDGTTSELQCLAPTGTVSDNTDCDDTSSTTYPGAAEYCDGIDSDCDGTLDEDDALDALTWYLDADQDGFGDNAQPYNSCTAPTGTVSDNTDCDDTSLTSYPGAAEYCDGIDSDCDGTLDEDDALDALTWYLDADQDGYGNSAVSMMACAQPEGYLSDMTDCDDTAADINPDAAETWYDGVDQDCDGMSDFDQDGDGFDSAEYEVEGEVGGDCDDESVDVNPDADEIWYDGVDQDCDGESDYDQDGDGFDSETYEGEDCDDASAETYPGAPDEPYDGIITDCDHTTDYDADQDGYESIEFDGDDCDDANSDINPGTDETWYDGVDQDCDGESDYDQDGDGYDEDSDCDDLDANSYPNAAGLDADCNLIGDKNTEDAGCACSTTSDSTNWRAGFSWVLGILGVGLLRRRRRNKAS